MAAHSLTLTKYNTKRVQHCAKLTEVANKKRYLNAKPSDALDVPMTKLPRIPTILFPEDVQLRPAVIDVFGSYGSYPNSATAIKEILSSVLNKPSNTKSTSVNALSKDNEVSVTEDSGARSKRDSRGDSDGISLVSYAQNDIRFNRHTAIWDNSQLDSSKTLTMESPASLPTAPITNTEAVPELKFAPYLKPCGVEATVPRPGTLSQREKRRFSLPSIAPHDLNLSPQNPTLEQFPLDLNKTGANCEAPTTEENSFPQRSSSCSDLRKESENSQTSSTENLLYEPVVNLEKENEHFMAADLFMSLLEKTKSCSMYDEQRRVKVRQMPLIKKGPVQRFFQKNKPRSVSFLSIDSGYGGLAMMQNSPTETILEEVEEEDDEEEEKKKMEDDDDDDDEEEEKDDDEEEEEEEEEEEHNCFGNCITCEEYEDYIVVERKNCEKMAEQSGATRTGPKVSAEQTARNLYRAFRQQWTAEGDRHVQFPKTNSFKMVPQKPSVPHEFETSVNLVEEIKRCKMREMEEWSPPQFQIITTAHKYARRNTIIASQNYLCAGCGTKSEPRYSSRLRYCDYLDKYFCDFCHHYAERSIPSRILTKWNFSKYYVSNVSKNIIDKIWDNHKFNVLNENPDVYKKVKELNRVKEVQQQLIDIKRLVMTCRFADSVVNAFEEVPSHLTQELHIFTLSDLHHVKQKFLLQRLRELLALTIRHVESCELCQGRGFICEFCRHFDVIHAFQTNICSRCEGCKTCYHKKCFKNKDCPKCIRIKAREVIINSFTLSTEVVNSTASVQ